MVVVWAARGVKEKCITWVEIWVVVDIPFILATHETAGKVHRLTVDGETGRALAHD